MSSYVAINVLTVPAEMGATLEDRFAKRAGMVEGSPGFEGFQLLRPVEGTDKYFVFTRWRSKDDFENWRTGMGKTAHNRAETDINQAPAGQGQREAQGPQAASGSELWAFEVVLDVAPKPADEVFG